MSRRTLATRLQYYGGDQLSRINIQKLRSLQAALLNDYNSRQIKTPAGLITRALINTNNLKPDYDKEYISVEFNSGLQAGDVFEVLDDGSHWMVYLPIITETAYLRAEIIKCRYTLEIDGEEYWIYFQGPTETDLRWFIKSGVNYNELNLSGTIYIKNDAKTKDYFKRFTKLKLNGHTWEVQVTDSISVPGIIELEIQEYYDNPVEELPEIIQETPEIAETQAIIGLSSVKANSINGYTIIPEKYDAAAKWEIANNPRVRVKETIDNGRICTVELLHGADGSFDLKYGKEIYHIIIEPANPYIQGPQEVFPYETHTYWIKESSGQFMVNSKAVEIIESTDSSCKIKIVSGKKGEFKVGCKTLSGEVYTLDVSIGSL